MMNFSPTDISIAVIVTNLVTAALVSLFKDRQFTTRFALIELRLNNIEKNTSRHRDDFTQV